MSMLRLVVSVVVAGLTLFAIGAVFHLVIPLAAPGIPPQFANVALFRPWAGWTSTYMILHPFGFGAAFALLYGWLRQRGLCAGPWGGLQYGLAVFLVGSLPIFLLAFASFQVSAEVMGTWILQNAVQYLTTGAVLGAIAARPEKPTIA